MFLPLGLQAGALEELAAHHCWLLLGAIATQTEAEATESLATEPLIQVAIHRPTWSGLGCLQLGDSNQRLPQSSKANK